MEKSCHLQLTTQPATTSSSKDADDDDDEADKVFTQNEREDRY